MEERLGEREQKDYLHVFKTKYLHIMNLDSSFFFFKIWSSGMNTVLNKSWCLHTKLKKKMHGNDACNSSRKITGSGSEMPWFDFLGKQCV